MYTLTAYSTNSLLLLRKLTFGQILPFIIAGILHFVIGRYILYTAVHHIGASSTMPIASTSNILAAFIAIPLLNEKITVLKIGGLITAGFGIGLIAMQNLNIKKFKKGFILSLVSAVIFASTSLIIRYGLLILNLPIIGILISYISAAPIYLAILPSKTIKYEIKSLPKYVLLYISIAGVLVNFGQLFRYLALSVSEVSVVAPLIATNPIFTILWSYLLNRRIENIDLKLVIGAIIIFIGLLLVIFTL